MLGAQVIDLAQPGTVVSDFQVLLDFVGAGTAEAAGKHQLLPMRCLADLNARLRQPLQIDLARPQLRSYPNLQGLYILLRSTGLLRVQGTGAKACLTLDPALHQSWCSLNATEQYFTLLEVWMLHAHWEVVGESGNTLGLGVDAHLLWEGIPKPGQRMREQDRQYLWQGVRRLCLVKLMDLFGLVHVEAAPPMAGGGWAPQRLERRPFGEAVFARVQRYFSSDLFFQDGDEPDGPERRRFGRLQPLFAPGAPAWRNNLVVPEPESRGGVWVFKVTLGQCWRRIAIGATSNLDELADAILRAYRFDDDHLYCFTYQDRFGAIVHFNAPFDPEGPWAGDVSIGGLSLEPGASMEFLFDFGDDWRFDVQLEEVDPSASRLKKPKVIAAHGKPPAQYEDWAE